MSKSKGHGREPVWQPKQFNGFTRERVVTLMKGFAGADPDVEAAVAATFLATLEPHGSHPGSEALAAALDTLRRLDTTFARELLWEAATTAQNTRVKTEAIRRVSPAANLPERSAMLRKWSSEGFPPSVQFQNDQCGVETMREAALNALGELRDPTIDDIDAVIAAMTPPENFRDSYWKIFHAAVEAYWKCGTVTSFDKVIAMLTAKNWRSDISLSITALAAKFGAEQLKKHAPALRKALREHAQHWQDDPTRTARLITLAERLATPEFLVEWAAHFGADGLEQGRGKVTRKLLDTVGEPSELLARAVLTLAQSPQNVSPGGLVLSLIRKAVEAGHAKSVADALVAQNQSGHNRIIDDGTLIELFPSARAAVRAVAESIASRKEVHDQRRQAEKVATGLLVAAARAFAGDTEARTSVDLITNRRRRGQRQEAELAAFVERLRRVDDPDNPIVVATQLAHDQAVAAGAAALLEAWLRPDDDLSRYAIEVFVREAGRAQVDRSPILERVEQFLLHPSQGEPVLRQPVEQALVEQVVLNGQVNRYAVDLICRENLGLEPAATRALAQLTTPEDAVFVLDRLAGRGASAMGVLAGAISFHREGNELLTEQVQAASIARATDFHLKCGDARNSETFARQLHDRFQDMPKVREAAYRACGRLGSFVSIRPLRDRHPKETVAAAKTAIAEAVTALREKLARIRPDTTKPAEINAWLAHIADLGDPSLLASAAGYLRPPHSDHGVRRAALNAAASMGGPQALDVVKRFIENTAPEGETLAVARRARMKLEQRNDAGLFETLGRFFDADAEVLDPALDYEALLGTHLMASTNRSLTKAQKLRDDGHWDEFITQINGVMEALIRHIFRTRYAAMGLDQQKGEKLGGGNSYAPVLAMTEFKTTYGKLQAHANTIQSFRRDSPTAHAMNKDGTAKGEASPDDAEYVREAFVPAFTEAVRALR